jgi:hypothetical protein
MRWAGRWYTLHQPPHPDNGDPASVRYEAAAMLALGGVYWLIRDQERQHRAKPADGCQLPRAWSVAQVLRRPRDA